MAELEIKNFPDLLKNHVDLQKKIKKFVIKKLPQAGYGSIMAKVAVTLEDKNGFEENLYTVAKLLPSDEFVRKVFQIDETYKNEVAFYHTVLPTLIDFQEKEGVAPLNSFAKYYGSRLSLDSDQVDDDAVLVLEDVSVAGYKNINRQEGFDLEGAKIILRDLARFHGTAIALKQKNPKLFEQNVKPFCRDFIFTEAVMFTNQIGVVLAENHECAHLTEKIGKWPCKVPEPREPYATIAHADLWVNNTMQKIVNGKIESNVFVDFQVYSHRSCASDVFFFLWTSCQRYVLENYLDDLLKYYHENLLQILKEFNCNISQFSFDKFLEDIVYECSYEFGHTLSFVIIVKHGPSISEENLEKKVSNEEILTKLPKEIKEFLYFMVKKCHKRGWLQ